MAYVKHERLSEVFSVDRKEWGMQLYVVQKSKVQIPILLDLYECVVGALERLV